MIPVVLSVLIPGLGQIYFGKNWRGILMLLLSITPLYPAILVWSVVDVIRLNRRGATPAFSRSEALWAIALLGVIVPAVIFLVISSTFTALECYQDRYLRPHATRAEASAIVQALEEFRDATGLYPAELSDVIGRRPLRRDWVTDAWGHQYRYTIDRGGLSFALTSPGPDGLIETDDDLVFLSPQVTE